jgi:hypothetical protein
MAKIPKGILTQIRKMCFKFQWSGKKEVDGIPLVKWQRLVMPTTLRGWGIKNMVRFNKDLNARSLWRILHN